MDIEIKGFVPTTMIDWEGKLATTLFVGGCNFRCPWCQNPDLVLRPEKLANIEWGEIEKHLRNKEGWLDGVVISGGEPTIHNWLYELLAAVKSLGYPVKLDTNGSEPKVLEKVIEKELVDFIAMDIKTSFAKYDNSCGVTVDTEKIKKSINMILNSSVDYEFRTTAVPGFVSESDILDIASYIKGAKRYVLQQFSPKRVMAEEVIKVQPYGQDVLQNIAIQTSQAISTFIRG